MRIDLEVLSSFDFDLSQGEPGRKKTVPGRAREKRGRGIGHLVRSSQPTIHLWNIYRRPSLLSTSNPPTCVHELFTCLIASSMSVTAICSSCQRSLTATRLSAVSITAYFQQCRILLRIALRYCSLCTVADTVCSKHLTNLCCWPACDPFSSSRARNALQLSPST